MWSYPESPWYDRINMLGERQNRWVSQSAWIKSLTASFIRSWDGRSGATGGLYGGRSKNEGEVLGWSRAQQAAFLIFAWSAFKSSVALSSDTWADDLRNLSRRSNDKDLKASNPKNQEDPAFYGVYSLICTDQGVRGYMQVLNDICYQRASRLKFNSWIPDERSSSNAVGAIQRSLDSLAEQGFTSFITGIGAALASFDWRTSSAPNLEEATRRGKLVFRGSGGYKELRSQLLEHLAKSDHDVGETAKRLLGAA
jgi:hypothetical protein